MRARLRVEANPERFPDVEEFTKPGKGPLGKWPSGEPIYPSRKPLLVRCDRGQIFGWVQAIMQYCTFIPGEDQNAALKVSPLIYKLEIAVKDPNAQKD